MKFSLATKTNQDTEAMKQAIIELQEGGGTQELEEKVNQNTQNITQNTSDITSIDGRVTAVESELENVTSDDIDFKQKSGSANPIQTDNVSPFRKAIISGAALTVVDVGNLEVKVRLRYNNVDDFTHVFKIPFDDTSKKAYFTIFVDKTRFPFMLMGYTVGDDNYSNLGTSSYENLLLSTNRSTNSSLYTDTPNRKITNIKVEYTNRNTGSTRIFTQSETSTN